MPISAQFFQQKPTQEDKTSSEEYIFLRRSYGILCDLADKMVVSDCFNILDDPQEISRNIRSGIQQQTLKGKKIFHIDLKHRQIFWQIYSDTKRTIKKSCLDSKETLYTWDFQDSILDSYKVIKVLGRNKYNSLKNRAISKQTNLKTICNLVKANYYTNFEEFLKAIADLINLRVVQIYDGRILQNFVRSQNNEELHLKVWEFYAYQLTKFWKLFWNHIQIQKTQQRYTKALYNDLDDLFNRNKKMKCKGGISFIPKKQKSFTYYPNQSIQDSVVIIENSTKKVYPKLEISLDIEIIEEKSLFSESYYKYPLPQNYPLINTYVLDQTTDPEKINLFRKSYKRPANTCHQKCQCLKYNGAKCPNLQRKIECQSHFCINSQIRNKQQVLCWYMDQDKNNTDPGYLRQKIRKGYQVKQFHSFGLDFYTVTVLYYLLPFHRVQDNQLVQNQYQKKQIIQKFIPYQLSNCQDLLLAVQNIVQKKQYEDYSFEAKILQKKLRFLNSMHLQNLKDQLNQKQLAYPRVDQLKGYYKGLGVANSGVKIPKGKFIGKFVGEILPPWRQEQKQIISTKYNNSNKQIGKQIKFYCITVQSHYDELKQPVFYSVDPQNKGNFCRSLNHSCDPNCKVDIIVSQGRYVLGVFAIKQISQIDQLTFDYMSVTDDYEQYRGSICLCSSLSCRGRYLKYQQQIYQGLDLNFLQVKTPIKKRIFSLIKLSKQKQHITKQKFDKLIKDLQLRSIGIRQVPQQLKNWFIIWIWKLKLIIQRQCQYVQNQVQNLDITILKYDDQLNEKDSLMKTIVQKEKISILNAKILKIINLMITIDDYSMPFQVQPIQVLIAKLQTKLPSVKPSMFQNFKYNAKHMSLHQKQSKLKNLRNLLINQAQYCANKNLLAAFNFVQLNIHNYKNYISQPIKIWMENSNKLQQKVQYQGKDLYIVQNLVTWPGQLKRMYKRQSNKLNKQKKITNKQTKITSPNNPKQVQQNQQQKFMKYKRQYIRQQIEQGKKIYEQFLFDLKLPDQVKDKTKLNKFTNFKRIKETLNKWIQKEALLLKKQQINQSKCNQINKQKLVNCSFNGASKQNNPKLLSKSKPELIQKLPRPQQTYTMAPKPLITQPKSSLNQEIESSQKSTKTSMKQTKLSRKQLKEKKQIPKKVQTLTKEKNMGKTKSIPKPQQAKSKPKPKSKKNNKKDKNIQQQIITINQTKHSIIIKNLNKKFQQNLNDQTVEIIEKSLINQIIKEQKLSTKKTRQNNKSKPLPKQKPIKKQKSLPKQKPIKNQKPIPRQKSAPKEKKQTKQNTKGKSNAKTKNMNNK